MQKKEAEFNETLQTKLSIQENDFDRRYQQLEVINSDLFFFRDNEFKN